MPRGPAGAPRLTNIGPLSRSTEDEIRSQWERCPDSVKEADICKETKKAALAVLESQGVFAECSTLPEINMGSCANIARAVLKRVDGVSVLQVGDGDHLWVEYNGVHYDAERPTGVSDYMQLPFFSRVPVEDMLVTARLAAEAEGREPPETIEDTVKDVTEQQKQFIKDQEGNL